MFQIDCVAENELTARINMSDAKFSFQEKGKWIAEFVLDFDRLNDKSIW